MIGDLFDSPWKILIVAVLLIVLFGSKKLPDAARSLGRSMRILKAEVSNLHEDESDVKASAAQTPTGTGFPAPAELSPVSAPQADQQSQIDALQQQIRDMQRAATMDAVPSAAEAPRSQQTS
jgi:sec-independent protein translocase protein TatA